MTFYPSPQRRTKRKQLLSHRRLFGLWNAPPRLMGLAEMVWSECLVYLDDVQTFKDHLQNLGLMLARLRTVGLKAKPSKRAFYHQQVLCLGHIVWSQDGIATNPSKTQKIKEHKKEIKQFLAIIQDSYVIFQLLYHLTERRCSFKWQWSAKLSLLN